MDPLIKKLPLNMFMNTFRFMVNMLVLILMTPYIIDKLGMDNFGLWCLLFSMIGFFSLLEFGMATAVVKCVAEHNSSNDHRERNEILSTYGAWYLCIMLISLLLAYFLAPNLGNLFSLSEEIVSVSFTLFWLLAVRTFIVVLPLSLYRSILFGAGFIFELSSIQILTTLIYAVLSVTFLYLGYGIIYLAIANLLSVIIEHVFYVAYAYKRLDKLHVHPANVRFRHLKNTLSFSIAALFIQIAVMVHIKMDPVLIKLYLPLSAVALYGIALKITENYVILLKQIANVLTPVICHYWINNQLAEIRQLFESGIKHMLGLSMLISICLACSAEPLITLWLGTDFAGAAPSLIVLCLSVTILAPQLIAATLLMMTGNHKTLALAAVVGVIINILASILLIKPLGIVGVAMGTLIAGLCVDIIIIGMAARKVLQLSHKEFFNESVFPCLIPSLVLLGSQLVFGNVYPSVGLIELITMNLGGVLLYILSYWHFSLNPKEQILIRTKINTLISQARFGTVEV